MRKYITEKLGIVELFQIIVVGVIIALGYYGFSTDLAWNKSVHKEGLNTCVNINRKINKTVLLRTECAAKLDIPDFALCKPYINKYYLRKTDRPMEVIRPNSEASGRYHKIGKFINDTMIRYTHTEVGFLATSSAILLTLLTHLIICHLPKISKNIHLRTKWNAAVQGVVLFSSGFAAVLIAISASKIDKKYDLASKQIQVCSLLRFCDRSQIGGSHPGIKKADELNVNKALDDFDACQQVHLKGSICILLVILIVMCTVMILMAMDLTTKYDEGTDDDEHVEERETGMGLDTLIEDQDVNFESKVVDNQEYIEAAAVKTPYGYTRLSTYSMMVDPT